ncbi:unnamed protein product, partial [Closterium sp. NIES-65]
MSLIGLFDLDPNRMFDVSLIGLFDLDPNRVLDIVLYAPPPLPPHPDPSLLPWQSLIGLFDLDPNRVLDCYEMHPTNSAFLHLVKLFPEVRAGGGCCAVQCCGGLCCVVLCVRSLAVTFMRTFMWLLDHRCFSRLPPPGPSLLIILQSHAPQILGFKSHAPQILGFKILGFKFSHYHRLTATAAAAAAAAAAAGSKGGKEGGGNSKGEGAGGEKGSAVKAGAGGAGGDGEGGEKGEGGSGAEGRIPDSLFVLAANCLKSNVVQLAALYPFLDPPDEEAEARSKEMNAQRIADVNRIGKINLAATGRDLTDDPQPADVTIDLYGAVDGQESAAAKEWGEAEGNDKMRLLKALLLVDDWPHARQLLEHLRLLHPVAHPPICTALCSYVSTAPVPCALMCDTILLQKLCKVLKADLLQARAAAATAAAAAATAAASAASSAPATHCNGLSLAVLTPPPAAAANGPISAEPGSSLASPDTAAAATTATPAAAAAAAAAEAAAAAAREVEGGVVEALEASLLPALQAVVASPPVCMQLWEVLACLPFQERYRLYGEWEKETETNPLVLAARQIARVSQSGGGKGAEKSSSTRSSAGGESAGVHAAVGGAGRPALPGALPAVRRVGAGQRDQPPGACCPADCQAGHALDTRRTLKRLAKENLKPTGRMVAKLAHSNPLTVLRTIVVQVGAAAALCTAHRENCSPPTTTLPRSLALKQLEFDILEYVVIERLALPRSTIKEDGLNIADWLQCLASFWGSVYAPSTPALPPSLPSLASGVRAVLLCARSLPGLCCLLGFRGLGYGALCKKYPLVELRGLLSYLVNRLHQGEAVELVLLQELMEQMAGIESNENLTEEQLEALAGGETLRQLTASFGQAKNNKAMARSMGRLKDALLPGKGEPNLAVPLLVLIARQRSKPNPLFVLSPFLSQPQAFRLRQSNRTVVTLLVKSLPPFLSPFSTLLHPSPPSPSIVFEAEGSHIKLLSEHFDRCHLIMLQYAQFLSAALSPPTSYAAFMPTLHTLSQRFHMPPEAAFLFYRPVLRLFKPCPDSPVSWPALAAASGAGGSGGGGGRGGEKEKRQQQQGGRKGAGDGVAMDGVVEDGVEGEGDGESEEDLVLCLGDAAATTATAATAAAAVSTSAAAAAAAAAGADATDSPVHWRDVVEWVRNMPPAAAWRGLSPPFYLLFWGLSLCDLHVPRQRYEAEMAKQRALLRSLEDVGDSSGSAIQKRKKEKERVQEVLDRLSAELARQQARVEAVQRRLVRDRARWLSPAAVPDSWRIVPCFLHHCVIPRVLMSPEDAVYCAKFILRMHAAATPQFCTFQMVDAFVCKSFHPLLASSSEAEAGRLGRFVLEILQAIYRWKSDAAVYNAECLDHPGSSKSVMKKPNNNMTLDQFRTINWKWNAKLVKVLSTLLESTEYMHIRNALTLLSRVSAVFPVTKRGGLVLERKVNRLEAEERQDLKLMATSVSAAHLLHPIISSFRDFIPSCHATHHRNQVNRLKAEERQDLKLMATSVSAALNAKK